jgi:hypothetical protein
VSSGRRRKKIDFRSISEHTGFDEFVNLIQSDGYSENRQLISIHPGASEEKVYHIYMNRYIDSNIQIGILNPGKPDYTFFVFFDRKDNGIIRVEKYKFKWSFGSRTLECKESTIKELIEYLS